MRWWMTALVAVLSSLNAVCGGDPVFATPLPHGPGTLIPSGGPLVAPVITPLGRKHGERIFEYIPPGWDNDRFYTREPARYTGTECRDPVQCSADCLGWVSLEFLEWATQGAGVPPLATTGPASLGPGVGGIPGQPTTVPLFGGQRLLDGMRPGFRIDAGLWKDETGRRALSGRFFFLGSESSQFVGVGTGANVLVVPQSVPVYVGFPGLSGGTLAASTQTNLLGFDTTFRQAINASDHYRCDALLGYRYLHLGDRLESFFDSIPATGTGVAPRLMGEDSVRSRNNFNGLDLGLGATGRLSQFTIEMRSTVALGVTAADVDRSRTRSVGLAGLPLAVPVVQAGGRAESSYFAVVPQFGVKLGWEPVLHLRLTAGYDFLYWSRVRRAQEQYDGSLVLQNRTGGFWAQGLGLGMELRY